MEIITGYTGKPHVTAEQDRDVNEGIFDTGSFVLKTGSQLAAELVSNNEIKVRDELQAYFYSSARWYISNSCVYELPTRSCKTIESIRKIGKKQCGAVKTV